MVLISVKLSLCEMHQKDDRDVVIKNLYEYDVCEDKQSFFYLEILKFQIENIVGQSFKKTFYRVAAM